MPVTPRPARRARTLALAPIALTLPGCIAGTLVDVATAPVKVASQAADWATTSQDEADRNRGRELREREEELGRLERLYADQFADCEDGDRGACADARVTYAEMDALRASLPAPPPED